ncbi:MAG: hypothetical protein ABW224_04490 [Kibdelosporangium sp.]
MSFADAVASFSNEVDNAVSRARRAAAEARDQSSRLRRPAEQPAGEATDPALRSEAVQFRTRQGLPVDEEAAAAVETPPAAQPGDEDDDFSQEQIMHRF